MKRIFRKFLDDRFALTTLQNPNLEVRSYAELVQAAQQQRENQPGAAPAAATPPPAPPDAPDSIPNLGIAANLPSTAPDPPSLAPLDSADPDSTDDEEPAPPPTPKPRRKAKAKSKSKSKSRRKSKANPFPALARALEFLADKNGESRHSAIEGPIDDSDTAEDDSLEEYESREEDDSTLLTSVERHARKCAICNHPDREEIEDAFLQWSSPNTIWTSWNIKYPSTIYDHAHAFNLFARRNRNLQIVLGKIIEQTDCRSFTGRDTIQAIRLLAHVNDEGRWVHPTSKSEVIFSTQRFPAAPPAVAALPADAQPCLPAAPVAQPAVADTPNLIATDKD